MNDKQSSESNSEDGVKNRAQNTQNLPKGFKRPKVLTFEDRVWQEEVTRIIRKLKKAERTKIKQENATNENKAQPTPSRWSKLIWKTKVNDQLKRVKAHHTTISFRPIQIKP
jgi:hypothetical protein